MGYGDYYNCILTHANSTILVPWIPDASGSAYIHNHHKLNLGIDISGTTLYCPCNGVIIFKGSSDLNNCIILQYSKDILLKFNNVIEDNVVEGQPVIKDSIIGRCKDFIHFEYLSTIPDKYDRPFMLYDNRYFYRDPDIVLSQVIKFDDNIQLDPIYPDKYYKENYPPNYIGGPDNVN